MAEREVAACALAEAAQVCVRGRSSCPALAKALRDAYIYGGRGPSMADLKSIWWRRPSS
ncbi:MAG: hypothetical protein V8S24_00085 [Gordonibacter pamelaeae]